MVLKINNISGGYGGKAIVRKLSFEVQQGEMIGIIGPNGCGKTTLLKMLTRIIPLFEGEILLNGKNIKEFSVKEFARLVAVVPQTSDQTFAYKVKEVVEMGRYSHQKGLFSSFSCKDNEVVEQAMLQTDVIDLADIPIQHLSGGQKQRVMLAQSLAQQSDILLLDEPTNHLDISYQKNFLQLLKQLTTEEGKIVITILHDINLASLFCDRILVLDEYGDYYFDRTDEILHEKLLSNIFQTQLVTVKHPQTNQAQFLLSQLKKEEQ